MYFSEIVFFKKLCILVVKVLNYSLCVAINPNWAHETNATTKYSYKIEISGNTIKWQNAK